MSNHKLDSEYGYSVFSKASRRNILSQKQIPRNVSQRSISNFSRQSQIEFQRKNKNTDLMISKLELKDEKLSELQKENYQLKKENHKLKKIKNGWSSKIYSNTNSQIEQEEQANQIENLRLAIRNLQQINANLQKQLCNQQNKTEKQDYKVIQKLQQKTNQVNQLKVQIQSLQKENQNAAKIYKEKIQSLQKQNEIRHQNELDIITNQLEVLQQENKQLKEENQLKLQNQYNFHKSNMNYIDLKMKQIESTLNQRPQMIVQKSEELIRLLELYKLKLREKDEEIKKNKKYIQNLKDQIHNQNIKLNELDLKNKFQIRRNNIIQSCKNFSLQEMPLSYNQIQNTQENQYNQQNKLNFSFNQDQEDKENSQQKQIEQKIVQQVLKNLELERLQQNELRKIQQKIQLNQYYQLTKLL